MIPHSNQGAAPISRFALKPRRLSNVAAPIAVFAGAFLMVVGTILALPGYAIVSLGGILLNAGDG